MHRGFSCLLLQDTKQPWLRGLGSGGTEDSSHGRKPELPGTERMPGSPPVSALSGNWDFTLQPSEAAECMAAAEVLEVLLQQPCEYIRYHVFVC